MKKGFASDNNSGVHPTILKAMEAANTGHVVGYGDDPFTQKAIQVFKKKFGENTEVFFVNERALVRPEFIINNNIYVDLVRKSDINERYKEICTDFSLSFGVIVVIPIETLPLLTEVTKQMFEQKYGINL